MNTTKKATKDAESSTMYALQKTLIPKNCSCDDYDCEMRRAKRFIIAVAYTFAKEDYCCENGDSKNPNKNRYSYPQDFCLLVHSLAELDMSDDSIHKNIRQCKQSSISFIDMEHLLYLLKYSKHKFSQKFKMRLQNVIDVLHFLIYNKKNITFSTDEKIIKKKLLNYILEGNADLKITDDLTLPQLRKKLYDGAQSKYKLF